MATGQTSTETPLTRLKKAGQFVGALRHSEFRKFFFGSVASLGGQQVITVAQGWLVYDLTGAPLYLGYVGLATAIPGLS